MADEQKNQAMNKEDEFASRIASAVATAVADATVKVQERINPIESRFSSKTSVFNPEGLQKRPKLRARYIFGGGEMKEKFLTNDEINLLNQVTEPGDFHKNRWHVRVRRDDSNRETVLIDFPSRSIDDRMELPRSLTAIVNEILAEALSQKQSAAKAK